MALDYESLDADSYEIRTLSILPGAPSSIVRCTMQKTNLITPIKYAALSYCWGDETITTGILVDDVEIQVTVNLENALQHLRKLGVSRLWVDALCINQTDKQEKGLQIRNMKQIYSKADTTYAWLGNEEIEGTKAVFAFLMSLQDPHSDTALTPTSHTCISMTSAPSRRRRRRDKLLNRPTRHDPPEPPQSGDCQCCKIESFIQGLRHILERPYWRRRWIIQETSASYRQFLLCGDATITLDEMGRAISLCRESCYWNSSAAKSFEWFDIITTFRRLYQENARPSLCWAIRSSRGFESTDPRDVIFSLLGLCHDGTELVLTPNYTQPMVDMVTDLTRALIWKHKWLDFILINGMDRVKRTGLEGLPSWAPDWLSENLPPQAYTLAVEARERDLPRICLGDTINRNISLGQGKFLRVQGTPIGRVATMTSTTNPLNASSLYPNKPIRSVPLLNSQSRSYYTKAQVRMALLTCLSLNLRGQHVVFPEYFHFRNLLIPVGNARVTWHTICLRCISAKSQPSHLNSESSDVASTKVHSTRMFSQWLETNATFQIRGMSLEGWIKEEKSSLAPLLRLLDPLRGIPAMILLVLLIWTPLIIIAILMSTGYRCAFSDTDATCSAPVVFPYPGLAVFFNIAIIFMVELFLHFDCRGERRQPKHIWDDWTQLVDPGKRLIVADKGFLGLVDDRAMEGDVLFNLVGCPETVILREVERIRDGVREVTRYVIVGKCYVHLTPADHYEYFGPIRGRCNTPEQEDEKKNWLNGPRKWELEEIELV